MLELLEKGEDAIMSIRNFGEKSLDELVQKMSDKGYLEDEEAKAIQEAFGEDDDGESEAE